MYRNVILLSVATFIFASQATAQTKSAIMFYDTTGTEPTSKMGWTGDAESGHFFIETPNDNNPVTVKDGNLGVDGTVQATKFVGDGSELTNLPLQDGEIGTSKVTGLSDSLAQKAPVSHAHSLEEIPGLTDSLSKKAPLSHSHGFDDLTGEIPESRIPHGEYMIDTVGDSGMVWKSDGEGRGYWGNDMVGDGNGSEITWTNVQGLDAQLNMKADTARVQALEDDVATLQSQTGGVSEQQLSDSVDNIKMLIGTKADTGDVETLRNSVYSKSETDSKFSETGHSHGSSDIEDGSIRDADIYRYANISGEKINPTFGTKEISTRKHLKILPGSLSDSSNHALLYTGYEGGSDDFALNLSSVVNSAPPEILCFWNLNQMNMKLLGPLYLDTIDAYFGHQGTPIQVKHSLNVQGTLTATECCSPSDRRLKMDISKIENGLQKVMALQGVYFKWRDNKLSSGNKIGLIAQDVQKVVPEVVQKDHEGTHSVDYSKLTAVLIEAVKEQQTQIEKLTSELDKQKQMLSNLVENNNEQLMQVK